MAAVRWLPILVGYNLIFVLPPFLLMAFYGMFGSRLSGRFERFRESIGRSSRETLLWLTGLVGFFLLADSLAYFEFFGLVDVPDAPRGV